MAYVSPMKYERAGVFPTDVVDVVQPVNLSMAGANATGTAGSAIFVGAPRQSVIAYQKPKGSPISS